MSDDLNSVALVFGFLLLLKKVADMDRGYYVRLFLLTAVLSSFIIIFFLGILAKLTGSGLDHCMPDMNTQY